MPESLRNSLVIFICTFDLFGKGDCVYLFENRCRQYPDMVLNDEAVKMFVNTRGCCRDMSAAFAALMDYFNGNAPTDAFTREVEEAVERVKQRADLSVEYMAWNAMKANLLKEGREEGRELGAEMKLISLVCKKLSKGCSVEETAGMLEEEPETIRQIYRVAEQFAPNYDVEQIYEALNLMR